MIRNINSNSLNSGNQQTFLLSWKDPNKTANYNLNKKKVLIDNFKRREQFIANYLNNDLFVRS